MTARGLALFVAAFTLIGSIGEARGGVTDIGLWFVDLTDVQRPVRVGLFVLLAASLLSWLILPRSRAAVRRTAAVACLLFAVFAARDVARFEAAVGSGLVRPAMP